MNYLTLPLIQAGAITVMLASAVEAHLTVPVASAAPHLQHVETGGHLRQGGGRFCPGAGGLATDPAKEPRTVRYVYFAHGRSVCRSAPLGLPHHTHAPRPE